MTKISLIGAGGKMGVRLSDNFLKNPQYEVTYAEIAQAGIDKLAERGIKSTEKTDSVQEADVAVLAVPDVAIGAISEALIPKMKAGALVLTLDPAAPLDGKNTMKAIASTILFLLLALLSHAQASLQVSANQRYLVKSDGTPFFWLGDTAWELFHRLNREEATDYLQNRADKKFNVIQAVALAELDGLNTPNPYGERPLVNNDPTTPNEAYFAHVDFIIDKAATLGLYIGLLPTWGDKVFPDRWGKGPVVFNPENAKIYGKWLGMRYRNRSNIIWILGGDRNPRNDDDLAIWRAMAAGITEGIGGADKALMTFHPQPNDLQDGGSSKWFHQDAWLDFNMFQTGHCRENNVWDRIQVAYQKKPIKPVLDGETIYEDHPVCFNAKDLGTSSAYDVRKHAYLDVFAGACGHTYGCHDIWQMYDQGREPINGPHFSWKEAMNLPGAGQMQYLRILMESRPILDRIPDQSLVSNARSDHDRIQATRGKDYLMVYSSQGKPFTLNLGKISGKNLKATWYNPRSGESKAGETIPNLGQKNFSPPSQGYGQDWVLILDDSSKNYPLPK